VVRQKLPDYSTAVLQQQQKQDEKAQITKKRDLKASEKDAITNQNYIFANQVIFMQDKQNDQKLQQHAPRKLLSPAVVKGPLTRRRAKKPEIIFKIEKCPKRAGMTLPRPNMNR